MVKALLVDDDLKFRVLFKRLLEKKFDFQVFEAGDGIPGLTIFEKESPDVIFLDLDLPNMKGQAFLEKVREKNQSIPVIILTNLDDRSVVGEIVKLGIQEYLLKTKFVTQMSDRLALVMRKLKLVQKRFGLSTGF
jgi:DNA-binding response OmpR family regulator